MSEKSDGFYKIPEYKKFLATIFLFGGLFLYLFTILNPYTQNEPEEKTKIFVRKEQIIRDGYYYDYNDISINYSIGNNTQMHQQLPQVQSLKFYLEL